MDVQCCQMSCCLAVDVVDLMMQRHEKCLRLASEIVLLQAAVSPARLCCTEVCIDIWSSCISAVWQFWLWLDGISHSQWYSHLLNWMPQWLGLLMATLVVSSASDPRAVDCCFTLICHNFHWIETLKRKISIVSLPMIAQLILRVTLQFYICWVLNIDLNYGYAWVNCISFVEKSDLANSCILDSGHSDVECR